jgi:hypothetical protein
VGLSTSDDLLRSTGTALPPVILGSLVIAVLLIGARVVAMATGRVGGRARWTVAVSVHGTAALLVAAGLAASFRTIPVELPQPLLVSLGVLVLVAGWPLLETAARAPVRLPAGVVVLTLTAGAGCLLWSWSLYATHVGTVRAESFAADLPFRESISLSSTERLAIAGSGVRAVPLTGTGSP